MRGDATFKEKGLHARKCQNWRTFGFLDGWRRFQARKSKRGLENGDGSQMKRYATLIRRLVDELTAILILTRSVRREREITINSIKDEKYSASYETSVCCAVRLRADNVAIGSLQA